MLRLERSRAAGKGFLGTGLGTQPSDHWVLGKKKKWGSQAPRGPRELGFPPVSSFEVLQARDLSGPSSNGRILSKTEAVLEQILAQG